MAKSSINFQKTKSNSVAETTRKFEAKYLLKKEHRKKNEYWTCGKTDEEVFAEELQKANRKGGRVPKVENSVWEAVVNLNSNHNIEDLEKLAKVIEEKLNIICTRIALHKDEGHYDENGKVVYNYHAHLNFVTYKDGKQNWRRQLITKEVLRELQTAVATELKMTRGEIGSTAVRANHRKFRADAPKIIEERKALAKAKDLKKEIAQLREQLKENGATRQEYAEIEQLNRDLKSKLELKELTIENLQLTIENYKNGSDLLRSQLKEKDQELNEEIEKNVRLEMELDQKDREIGELKNEVAHSINLDFQIEEKDREIANLKEQLKKERISEYELNNRTLTKDELIDYLFAENDKKDREIGELKTKLADLQKKNSMYLGMNKDLKDEISSLKTLINERETQNDDYEGIDVVNSFLDEIEPSEAINELMSQFGKKEETEEEHKITYLDR